MAEVTGFKSLKDKLQKRIEKSKIEDNVSVVVGYQAAYAIYVHERTDLAHGEEFNTKHAEEIAKGQMTARGPNQQSKYLETPARRMNNDGTFSHLIKQEAMKGRSLRNCLLLCGLLLQGESQRICPVDADNKAGGGNLRASAFTEVEEKK